MDPLVALAGRPAFDRTRGVGGTDAAAIMNLSPWRDPLDVWMEKTHHPQWTPKTASDAMKWGNLLEPVVRAAYEAKSDRHVLPGPKFDEEPMWAEDGIRYFHPDGWVLGPDGTVEGLWEGKTSSNPEAWADGVPDYYQVQVQQGMDICQLPWCDVSVLINGNDFRTYRIVSDPALQENIRTEIEPFWAAVQTGLWDFSPMPLSVQYPVEDPDAGLIVADADLNAAAKTLLEIKRRIADLTESGEKVRDNIERAVKDAPGATGDGWYLDWRASKPPTTTEWEAVATSLWNALESIRRDMGYGVRDEEIPPKVLAMLDPKLWAVLRSLYTTTGKQARPFVLKEGVRK